MDYSSYKKEVFDTTLKLVDIDLIRLSSGNVSVRIPDGNVAITPSGVPYDLMKPEDIAHTVLFLLSLSERCAIDEIYIRRRKSKPF